MTEIGKIHIKCKCSHRFPSPIFIGSVEMFEAVVASGNKAECPKCRSMVDCNKDNMSYELADGSGGSMGYNYGDKSDS